MLMINDKKSMKPIKKIHNKRAVCDIFSFEVVEIYSHPNSTICINLQTITIN